MLQISASLLAADYARLGHEARRAQRAGVDSLHFDMMDGHYVPNLALTPDHLPALRKFTNLPFHVHLELANPDQMLENFKSLAADLVIVCHDTLTQPERTLSRIQSRGMGAGLSLNPDEALEAAQPFLSQIDLLLILGVFPGFGGQQMQECTVEKVAQARQMVRAAGLQLRIAVDGGVNRQTAPALIRAGADLLIIGTALFQAPSIRKVVRELGRLAVDSPCR